MLFSDPRFFGFFTLLLVLLRVAPTDRARKGILTVASCLFYAAWDYRYPVLLFVVAAAGHVAAVRIEATTDPTMRRHWLWFSIVTSIGILGWFKYANFFIATTNALVPTADLPLLSIILPAGVSFYTFKTMSYAIDVYRGELRPCRSLLDYAMFATFFPELIAGPIVRASVFLPQMNRHIGPTRSRLATGASIFLLGLTKKWLIADRLAMIADPIFADPSPYASTTIWVGVVAYSAQIYCDFSGYSDMAIGTAKMIGYDLPRNFHLPYLSANIADFWRRWHITLSTWLRDYLYVPMGGNRRGTTRTYVNLMLTMTLGGLWHGASWNFVAWGAVHGAALAVHRAWRELTDGRFAIWTPLATALTLLFVVLCWIPFRAPTFAVTFLMLKRCFVPHPGTIWLPPALGWCLALMAAAHALGAAFDGAHDGASKPALARLLRIFGARLGRDEVTGWWVRLGLYPTAAALLVVGWVLTLFLFVPTATQPFIYFQF
ncbi:MAG: MBOAT family protein [Deltaproteobacteria bacterium]|nr:MBOAT family protein [Deltaproteobacteria bacterium]